MEQNVWAVLQYFLKRDYKMEIKLSSWPENDSSPKPRLILKRGLVHHDVIHHQIVYVTKGCLTDPNQEGGPDFDDLPLYQQVGHKIYCVRGTAKNE
jgi:hypothetical protein